MTDTVYIKTPVGRFVSGDVYKGNEKDAQGNPYLVKSGPDIGKPTKKWYMGVAIPKTPGVMWDQEPWGAMIMAVARRDFPQLFDPQTGAMQPQAAAIFSFKISDGDDNTPNDKGRIPSHNEGWPGNWVLHFQNGFPPKCYNRDGTVVLLEPIIKRGHFVEINAQIKGNNTPSKPGIFLNHSYVSHNCYGEEITSGPDASQLGFGADTALPAGGSMTPITAGAVDAGAQPGVQPGVQPQVGMQPGAQPQVGMQPGAQPQVGIQPQLGVQPGVTGMPVQQQHPGTVQPATDLIQAQPGIQLGVQPGIQPQLGVQPQLEQAYLVEGQRYTRSQLLAIEGWTEAHLANLQPA